MRLFGGRCACCGERAVANAPEGLEPGSPFGNGTLPIPNSFPKEMEDQANNYNFYASAVDKSCPEGRWTSGPSLDGNGTFTVFQNKPMGETPNLGPARPDSGAEKQQIG